MANSYDYGKRADEVADAMRRYLVGINTGGVAVALTFAANAMENGIHPGWIIGPVLLFVLGLGVSGGSLLLAKHKALKRKQAAVKGERIPEYKAWHQQNFTYELLTLIVFLCAVGVGLYELQRLQFQQPKTEQNAVPPKKEAAPNNARKSNLGDAARPSVP
jgi:hypothetical protein